MLNHIINQDPEELLFNYIWTSAFDALQRYSGQSKELINEILASYKPFDHPDYLGQLIHDFHQGISSENAEPFNFYIDFDNKQMLDALTLDEFNSCYEPDESYFPNNIFVYDPETYGNQFETVYHLPAIKNIQFRFFID